jgi:DNA-binding MarR family transcriptional regulator
MWHWDQYHWFIKCLMDAQVWETKYHPLLGTVVGRHVFLSIVRELEGDSVVIRARSLKQIFSHPTLTDRAVRLKLRELEREGFICMELCNEDGRTRTLRVTPKFTACMEEHKHCLAKYMDQKFLLILKNQQVVGA